MSARRWAMLALAAASLGLAACEGDNLFTGDGPSLQPRVLEIGLPQQVRAGETIGIRVDAVAPRYVNQVIVSVRGAAQQDTVVAIDAETQQVSTVIPVQLPAVLADTILIVEAQVSDMAGVRSPSRQAISAAFGPPTVESVGILGGVRPGETASINVIAFGSRGISQLRVSARGAFTRDTAVSISPAQSSVNRTIALPIPAAVDDTLATISVTALDASGIMSEPETATLPFIVDPPTIAIVAPPSVAPGGSLNIQVMASSLRQVARLLFNVYDSNGFTIPAPPVAISPPRTSVSQFVTISIPGGILAPTVTVEAYAEDRSGTVSSAATATVSVPSGGPQILAVDAPATAMAGHLVDVRVNATGVRPIKEVLVRWRGFVADSLQVPETKAVIDPPRYDVSQDFTVRVPCYQTDGELMILVTAKDEAEQQSAVSTAVVAITGNPECEVPEVPTDSAAPRMPRRSPAAISGSSAPLSWGDATDAFRAEPFMLVDRRGTSRRGRRRRV